MEEIVKGKIPENCDPIFTMLCDSSKSLTRMVKVLSENLSVYEYRALCRQLEDGDLFVDGECLLDSVDAPDSLNREFTVQVALERGIFWTTLYAVEQLRKK